MIKIIKPTGLVLFLMGFALFMGSFFMADYTLTPAVVKAELSKEKQSIFLRSANILHKTYSSSFGFVNDLDKVFTTINNKAIEKYGITDEEISKLAAHNPKGFDIKLIEDVFDNNETGGYKQKAFKDYGSWLDGRQFGNQQELEAQLQAVATNIENYQITTEKGFDKYAIKNLKYRLTKASGTGPVCSNKLLFLVFTYGMCIVGALMYILPKWKKPPGIQNEGIFYSAMKNVGWLGIATGTFLIVFYIILYFYPEYMTNWIIMVDPLSYLLNGNEAGRFFLYGFIYTLCILVMGVRMLIKYRYSNYHVVRTLSVMFFQTAFAFLIPEILVRLNQPYFDFKNIWPLDYDFFFESQLDTLIANGTLGIFMLGWGIALIILAVPVFTFFFGKRWYCSWVCGCGGLAETLGDPYRQLSDKSLKAWKIERWMVHSVLLFAIVMTAGVLYTYWTAQSNILGIDTYNLRSVYGAWIGAGFAGVVGTGFYPFMGNRVWCRFGCPLAAYLGLIQRFRSRFRITTNGGQCISCGNCSTYCEMGIDVRWYAQRGQNIIRASCVGCGVCASVCPRGVLKLENKDPKGRFDKPVLIGNQSVKINN